MPVDWDSSNYELNIGGQSLGAVGFVSADHMIWSDIESVILIAENMARPHIVAWTHITFYLSIITVRILAG